MSICSTGEALPHFLLSICLNTGLLTLCSSMVLFSFEGDCVMNPIEETALSWPGGVALRCCRAPALGRGGEFDTGTGVTLVTPNTLQAAVVINVTDAGGAYIVHFSMGELCAFNVHFNLLSL